MKFPISFHLDRYNNNLKYIKKEEEDITNRLAIIESEKRKLKFYKLQIDSAREKGKDGFDRDRYLVKRATR